MPRRTALLVGINYNNNPDATLNGCYNDVVNVSQYLRSVLGYAPGAITMLTDGNRGSAFPASVAPTRQNILAGLSALVAGWPLAMKPFSIFLATGPWSATETAMKSPVLIRACAPGLQCAGIGGRWHHYRR